MNGKPVVIIGIGDFGRIARFYLEHDSKFRVVAHAVSAAMRDRDEFCGLPVVALEDLPKTHAPEEFDVQVGIAYSRVNKNRREMFEMAKHLGYQVISYVCSKAITWPDLDVGEGSFVFEANVIQPYVRIGSNTVLWSGNHIGHDSTIGNHVFIASHVVVSGNCRVGDNTFIGVNATLRDGISIGANCVIGAGTLILNDVPDGTILKGTESLPLPVSSDRLSKI